MNFNLDELSRIPYFDQYVGVWAMHEPTFVALFDRVKTIDLSVHMSSEHVQAVINEAKSASNDSPVASQYRTTVKDGVAVIRANGVLMKQASSMSGGTSTVLLRQSIMAATRDDSIKSILLAIESPGGTSSGTFELANTIANAGLVKPIIAHIEDLGASAAYWLASATQSISANAPANVGSIGTYAVVQDWSAAAAKEGVKVHVVRAGAYKGIGEPGTEITAEHLALIKSRVDSVNEFFIQGVQDGRKLTRSQVEQLADGRVHIAATAKELGLIDHVRTFEESFSEAVALASRKTTVRGMKMSETTTAEPKAATIAEIKAACPGITADKVVSYAESNKTLDQCKDLWMHELATENAAKDEQIAKANAAKAEAEAKAETAAKLPGVDPLKDANATTKTASNSAKDAFWAAVREEEKTSGKSQMEAMKAVNGRDPSLREAMLAEARTK